MGVLAALNQFRSQGDGADIRYKMGEKAKKGGTLGRAKLGYLNIRERVEGREVRTVAIDAERAPFVKTAFELYATGEYSIDHIQAVLAERGLVGRPGRHPAGPVSTSKIQTMLRDPYYCGVIVYDGELYKGRHEPLVSEELFEKVQRVFDTRNGWRTAAQAPALPQRQHLVRRLPRQRPRSTTTHPTRNRQERRRVLLLLLQPQTGQHVRLAIHADRTDRRRHRGPLPHDPFRARVRVASARCRS